MYIVYDIKANANLFKWNSLDKLDYYMENVKRWNQRND